MDIRKNLKNLVSQVRQKNTAGAKKTIFSLLNHKAVEKLADKKVEVTKNLFNKGK